MTRFEATLYYNVVRSGGSRRTQLECIRETSFVNFESMYSQKTFTSNFAKDFT